MKVIRKHNLYKDFPFSNHLFSHSRPARAAALLRGKEDFAE
jgi:hypothetical protein